MTTPPTIDLISIEKVPTTELIIPPRAGLPSRQRSFEPLLKYAEADRPILVLMPGSESFGHWCIEWKRVAEIEDWGVDVRIVSYNPPPVKLVALFPWQIRRNRAIRRQLNAYIEAAISNNREIFIVTHSYGTYALVKYLRRMYRWKTAANRIRQTKKIAGIVLIAGIAKRKHLAEIRGACRVLVNDLAVDDAVPIKAAGYGTPIVPMFWNPYDDIGTTGVRTDTAQAVDRYFVCGDIDRAHSHLVSVEHARANILPIVEDGLVTEGTEPGPAIVETTLFIYRSIRTVVGFIGYAITGAIAIALYRGVDWWIGY